MKKSSSLLLIGIIYGSFLFAQDSTYAEKLGFPKGKKVVIFHVDDVGMSLDGNHGAIEAMEKGVATSCSIMMIPAVNCLDREASSKTSFFFKRMC